MPSEQDWNDRLTALNALLAYLYPTEADSRRVVAYAGLRETSIKFDGAASINWYNILNEARKRGRVDDIVRVAKEEFPNRAAELDRPTKWATDAGLLERLKNNSNPVNAERDPSISPASPPDRVRASSVESQVVILVHGIRDYALWQNSIRSTLERAGFKAEPTNYDRFNLIKFLLPIWFFRRQAIEEVWKQIRIIAHNNPNTPIFGDCAQFWDVRCVPPNEGRI
jgi:hypothetical protein